MNTIDTVFDQAFPSHRPALKLMREHRSPRFVRWILIHSAVLPLMIIGLVSMVRHETQYMVALVIYWFILCALCVGARQWFNTPHSSLDYQLPHGEWYEERVRLFMHELFGTYFLVPTSSFVVVCMCPFSWHDATDAAMIHWSLGLPIAVSLLQLTVAKCLRMVHGQSFLSNAQLAARQSHLSFGEMSSRAVKSFLAYMVVQQALFLVYPAYVSGWELTDAVCADYAWLYVCSHVTAYVLTYICFWRSFVKQMLLWDDDTLLLSGEQLELVETFE